MPTESKSETPRTDEVKFETLPGFNSSIAVVEASFARQLEKELNEANLKCARERRISLAQSNLAIKAIEERHTLAKELAEVKEANANANALIGNQAEENDKINSQLAKENEQLRIECQQNNEASYIWDMEVAISERDQLAKENKVMREALKLADDIMATWYSSEYIEHPKRMVVLKALNQPNITNLIVLTRNELIAEIEKLACGCRKALDNRNPHSARARG